MHQRVSINGKAHKQTERYSISIIDVLPTKLKLWYGWRKSYLKLNKNTVVGSYIHIIISIQTIDKSHSSAVISWLKLIRYKNIEPKIHQERHHYQLAITMLAVYSGTIWNVIHVIAILYYIFLYNTVPNQSVTLYVTVMWPLFYHKQSIHCRNVMWCHVIRGWPIIKNPRQSSETIT